MFGKTEQVKTRPENIDTHYSETIDTHYSDTTDTHYSETIDTNYIYTLWSGTYKMLRKQNTIVSHC